MPKNYVTNYLLSLTAQEKINIIKQQLQNSIHLGEHTWASLRHQCNYEELFGYANNKRERQKFKDILHNLADIEELSNTRCRIKKIYTDDTYVDINHFDRRTYGNNRGKGIWQNKPKYALLLYFKKQLDSLPSSTDKQVLYLNSTELGKIIGLVNFKYNNLSYENTFLHNNPTIKEKDIRNMKFHCKSILNRIVYSALRSIQNLQAGISFRHTYRFYRNPTSIQKSANESLEYSATEEDIYNIESIYTQSVLDEMNILNLRIVYLHNRETEFYNKVLEQFNHHNNTNYTRMYRTIEICINPVQFYSFFNTTEKKFFSKAYLNECKQECNTNFIAQLEKNTSSSYLNACMKIEKYMSLFSEDIIDLIELGIFTLEELLKEARLFKFADNYLSLQKKCRDEFVSLS